MRKLLVRHLAEVHGVRRGGLSNWLLCLAWLLLLVVGLGVGLYVASSPSWMADSEAPAAGESVARGHLSALPAGTDPLPAPEPAWRRYAAPPVAVASGRPLVAIVITGLGRDEGLSTAAVDLPAPLSLAFSPYGRPFDTFLVQARAAGHEVLVDLPMEGENGAAADLGPRALLTLLDVPRNLERLNWILGDAEGTNQSTEPLVGAVVIAGQRFLQSPDLVQPVLDLLAERGLMVVSPQVGSAALQEAAADEKLPLLFVDRNLNGNGHDLQVALAELERIALVEGAAVGTLRAEAGNMAALVTWAASLEPRGFYLVPATQVLAQKKGLQ